MSFWSRRDIYCCSFSGQRAGCLRTGQTTGFRTEDRVHHAGRPPVSTEPLPNPPTLVANRTRRGAGVRFRQFSQWGAYTPGWYIPVTVSAGAALLIFRRYFLIGHDSRFRELSPSCWSRRGTGNQHDLSYGLGLTASPGLRRTITGLFKEITCLARIKAARPRSGGHSAVHNRAGASSVYVEGFIINQETKSRHDAGRQWSLIGPRSSRRAYPGNWTDVSGSSRLA